MWFSYVSQRQRKRRILGVLFTESSGIPFLLLLCRQTRSERLLCDGRTHPKETFSYFLSLSLINARAKNRCIRIKKLAYISAVKYYCFLFLTPESRVYVNILLGITSPQPSWQWYLKEYASRNIATQKSPLFSIFQTFQLV